MQANNYTEPYSQEWEDSIEEMLVEMELQYNNSFSSGQERIEFERSINL